MTAAQDQVKFWRAPSLGNIELLHATYIKQRFVPHVHEEYAVGVVCVLGGIGLIAREM